MSLFPVFLNLQDKECLVVGGGPVAERKVRNLLECQARVLLVSPRVTQALEEMAQKGMLDYRNRTYCASDVEGIFLVFIATNHTELNQQVMEHCRERGILVNAVDDPPNCDFYVPSVIRRQSLSIAISTEGKSPLLARKLREELEEQIPAEYGQWVENMGRVREYIKTRVPDTQQRQALYKSLLDPDMWEIIKSGQEEIIRERIEQCISSWRA